MNKRNSLGRGLGALIEGADTSIQNRNTVNSICAIPLDLVEVNPFQPRKTFDEEALKDLSQSILKLGVIQPITVRLTAEGKYQIISGERRYRASLLANMTTIPAYIKSAEEQDMMEMALVENIQRNDLNAIEIALSFQSLIEQFSLTQESLSERVGKKRATIANYLRLLKLPSEIQLGIRDNLISMGHARALLSFEDPEMQLDVYHSILEEGLSVRKIEDWAREATNVQQEVLTNNKPSPKKKLVQWAKEAGQTVENRLHTKVEVKMKNENQGKLIIPFDSQDKLQTIIDQLLSAK